jgi:exoribonuclease-2
MKKTHQIDLKSIALHAMEKYGFASRYPGSVIRDATDAAAGSSLPRLPGSRDMRDLLWSSIDNIDSEDLDQVEYCERLPDTTIHIFVAIADVDAYVPKGSAADRYAAHNGTSVYPGITTFPMLPDILSKGITSLLPEQDRLAIVTEYSVPPDGSVWYGGIFPAIVRNKAKLVYEETGEWLAGNSPVPSRIRDVPGLEEMVLLQNEAATRLRKERMRQGALDLETLEASPVLENGTIKDLILIEQNPARIIIEELMVAANRTMIAKLERQNLPVIERVVRTPKNWEGIVRTAEALHYSLPKTPDAKSLSAFLIRQKTADPERFPDLSLTIVKLMGPGEYMMLRPGEEPYGHFALAVTDYTHATAPNRRYPDLVNQRLIKSVLRHEPPPYTPEELGKLAEHLTDREKASKKVERFMQKAAAAVLLRNRIGEVFDALVTGSAEKGTYVRILSPPVEGRVVQNERGLNVGEKIKVRLISVDAYNAYIDFTRVPR